jgi:hypothetical protein
MFRLVEHTAFALPMLGMANDGPDCRETGTLPASQTPVPSGVVHPNVIAYSMVSGTRELDATAAPSLGALALASGACASQEQFSEYFLSVPCG